MEDQKRFYENQMDAMRSEMAELRKSQQGLIDAAVSRITKSFEEQIAKLAKERDAALLSARGWRGVLGEHVHRAIEWFSGKMSECWMAAVRRSWILMLDETRVLVGVKNKETKGRNYRDRYMWGIWANSAKLVWFLYEDGSRGAAAIIPFLEGFQGFYTTDGYVVYKIFDSGESADAEAGEEEGRRGRRSACLVHIRRKAGGRDNRGQD